MWTEQVAELAVHHWCLDVVSWEEQWKWQALSLIIVVTPLLLTMGATAEAQEINCLHCKKEKLHLFHSIRGSIINLPYSWAIGQEKWSPVLFAQESFFYLWDWKWRTRWGEDTNKLGQWRKKQGPDRDGLIVIGEGGRRGQGNAWLELAPGQKLSVRSPAEWKICCDGKEWPASEDHNGALGQKSCTGSGVRDGSVWWAVSWHN